MPETPLQTTLASASLVAMGVIAPVLVAMSAHAQPAQAAQSDTALEGVVDASDEPSGENAPEPFLLFADTDAVPVVTLTWTDLAGRTRRLTGERPYSADAFREPMPPVTDPDADAFAHNVSSFVAMGGARLDKSAGSPKGAIVRVGFYKTDPARQWFPRTADGGGGIDHTKPITVKLEGVRLSKAARADAVTAAVHLKYAQTDLDACGLPIDAGSMYLTAHPGDGLAGRTRRGIDVLPGALIAVDGGGEPLPIGVSEPAPDSSGTVSATTRDDGRTIDLELTIGYAGLRHMLDPWRSDRPGTFLEPVHFHVEIEARPPGVERQRLAPPREPTERDRVRALGDGRDRGPQD